MEGILLLGAIIIGWIIVRKVIGAGVKTVRAAAKTAAGKGSFNENMEVAFRGLGQFELRLNDVALGNDGKGPVAKAIECKGLFPESVVGNVAFLVSLFDNTSEELQPVIAVLEDFQEPFSTAFQSKVEIGEIELGLGIASWVRVGAILPDILQPPRGGRRNLVAVCRFVDVDSAVEIHLGFGGKDDDGILWQRTLQFDHHFANKGYIEAAEHRDEAKALSVKIGIAIAMSDGTLDGTEGATIQSWIRKEISTYTDTRQQELKKVYNDAMREAYEAARRSELVLSEITSRLNQIGEISTKYETLELCFDVMAADGVADAEELRTIRRVADALELDFDEIERMKDQKIIELGSDLCAQASIEDILGIDPSWGEERTKEYLRDEFQKWNNRLMTLCEGEERHNAQRMLDLISEARVKYAR